MYLNWSPTMVAGAGFEPTVRVGTKHLRCTLFEQTQVPAQPLRSLDSATGGAPLRPTGLFLYGRTIHALAGKIRNAKTSDRLTKVGRFFFGGTDCHVASAPRNDNGWQCLAGGGLRAARPTGSVGGAFRVAAGEEAWPMECVGGA